MCWFCAGPCEWISLSLLPSPILELQHPLLPFYNVASQGVCPIPLPLAVFSLGLTFEFLKEVGMCHFCCHNWMDFLLSLATITCIALHWKKYIQTMYWSHQISMGPFNVSNATSTCCLHSWHEIETFIPLANKKNPSSCNIHLTTH